MKRDFYAKKYTVLMGNEPIDLWLKNGQVKNAKFMDQKVALDLDPDTIQAIRDQPSRVVNGSNLTDNLNFTQNISRMISQKLELAITKNDKKVMSRFARSDLIPENMKQDFYKAINRPNGLRGMLVRAVNRTNAIFQNLAKKIDRFFDKVNDHVANQKVDKYLEQYQLTQFNKAPPVHSKKAFERYLDPKLMEMAEDFYKKHYENSKLETVYNPFPDQPQALLENEFLKSGVAKGFSITDSKTALYQIFDKKIDLDYLNHLKEWRNEETQTIEDLKAKLEVHELKSASKNDTLEDFQTLAKKLPAMDKIDVLVENKAYLALNEAQKQEFEDKHLFNAEPIQERAEELKALVNSWNHEPKKELTKEIIFERNPKIDFSSEKTKEAINTTWQKLQIKNRQEQAQNRDFMNISAVKFGGVSEKSLQLWAQNATKNGIDATITAKFVEASLRNAEQLQKAGIMKETTQGEYRFTDNFAKQSLYENLNAPVAYIQKMNQGTQKEITVNPQAELKERVAQISSPISFEKLLDRDGNIDSQQLHKFAEHLTQLATQLHQQEHANVVTKEDLKMANQSHEQQQASGMER